MGALLIPDNNLMVGQGDQAYGINQIAEDMAALGHLISPADLGPQQGYFCPTPANVKSAAHGVVHHRDAVYA